MVVIFVDDGICGGVRVLVSGGSLWWWWFVGGGGEW